MITPPESAPRMVAAIRRGMAAAGRPQGSVDIAGCGWFSVAEDARAAQDVIRRIVAYFGPYLEEEALNSIGLSVKDFAPVKERVEAGDYHGRGGAGDRPHAGSGRGGHAQADHPAPGSSG